MALGLLANSDSALPDVAIWAHGILATARIRQGKLDLAADAAGAIEADIARSSGVGYLSAPGLSGLAEVYLTQWERGPASAGIPEAARQACQALRRYARRYRSALPGALLWRGWSYWLAGHRRRAHRAWRRSLMTAERLLMPYDQGLAHYEIARHLDPQEPAHSDHLRRATEIFAGLGAAYDLGRARDLARSGSTGG
jgi:tetratricopeptide (TPR) repeat protein